MTAEYVDGSNDLSEEITRDQFEDLCQDLFARCLKPVEKALREAGKSKQDIDDVILVGGTSRIPKIHKILTNFFGKRPYEGVDPQEAVARGAAILAAKLKNSGGSSVQQLSFYDICPVSLGIQVGGGGMSKLIMKSSRVPVSVTKRYSVGGTDWSTVNLNIYRGERGVGRHCHKVAIFTLSGIPPAEGGTYKVDVTFTLTEEGKLDAHAELVGASRVSNTVRVERNLFPYSESELQAMISAAEDYQEQDEREADEGARTFKLRLLDENLAKLIENEQNGYAFRTNVSTRTKESLKTLVHDRYVRSQESALPWTEVQDTKERIKRALRRFFMKSRGSFPPWLD
jgi:molecular chaperone DnaK (HSP70)